MIVLRSLGLPIALLAALGVVAWLAHQASLVLVIVVASGLCLTLGLIVCAVAAKCFPSLRSVIRLRTLLVLTVFIGSMLFLLYSSTSLTGATVGYDVTVLDGRLTLAGWRELLVTSGTNALTFALAALIASLIEATLAARRTVR